MQLLLLSSSSTVNEDYILYTLLYTLSYTFLCTLCIAQTSPVPVSRKRVCCVLVLVPLSYIPSYILSYILSYVLSVLPRRPQCLERECVVYCCSLLCCIDDDHALFLFILETNFVYLWGGYVLQNTIQYVCFCFCTLLHKHTCPCPIYK